ncbi:MAG TPA: DUF3631 domain-containing protein [Candidatus Acidoferrum sp.]|nr:DUF3631 domain-containing protein [Candidatus Acidoferrum sp.]
MKTETIIFDPIIPHPAPVNISDLLAGIEGVITRHVILNDHAAAALAVWVLHTYVFERRDTVAYVAIESPEKRCGKTTLLSVLAAMACKPLIASNITVGALFRSVHTCSPTLFIDEADTFMAGNGTMRGIINSGNTRRTAYVLRLSKSSSSSNFLQPSTSNIQPVEPADTGLKKYSCWCPKVIAMIGQVPDTIADRSIVVKMARKLTTETCAPLSQLDTADIKAKCARFGLDMAPLIGEAGKIRGEGLNDRAADTFDPLFVIARLAGEAWEQKLQAAAAALSSTADENSGTALILDIVSLFGETGSEKMFSRDIVTLLRNSGLKSETLKYSSINEYHISKILRQYGIRPINIRIGSQVHRGYVAADFTAAVIRYVSEADREKLLQELNRRWNLQKEASIEAEKQEMLFQKFRAAIPRGTIPTDAETQALILKLKKEQEMSDLSAEQPASP